MKLLTASKFHQIATRKIFSVINSICCEDVMLNPVGLGLSNRPVFALSMQY
jgi:hypothetical protein